MLILFVELTNARQLVGLEGFQVISAKRYRQVVLERRLMALALLACCVCILLFIISIATLSWARVDIIQSENLTSVVRLGIWGNSIARLSIQTVYETLKNLISQNDN